MPHSNVDGMSSKRSFTFMDIPTRGFRQIASSATLGQGAVNSRPMRATHIRLLPLLAGFALACGGESDDAVTISGDVAGLDTLALRGEALIAEADRAPSVIDSMLMASQQEIRQQFAESLAVVDPTSRAATVGASASSAGTLSTPSTDKALAGGAAEGSAMSRRAQARGDSMARAFAARLAGTGTGADRARADTVRGQLVWAGVEPARTVVLRAADGNVTLSGMATTGMSKLVGSEVVVRGVRLSPRDVVVSDFFVRAADGVAAFDGTVQSDGALRLSDGSGVKRIPLPAAMQGLTGARVWVAVKDGKPYAYGLIQNR
jgi:hypothetical protein